MKTYLKNVYHLIVLLSVLPLQQSLSMDLAPETKDLPFPKVFSANKYDNFKMLLLSDAAPVKQLINQNGMKYVNKIISMETTLRRGLESNNYNALHGRYGEETLHFIRCIAYRQEDCKKWKNLINQNDLYEAEKVIERNPYMINYYFISPEYGGCNQAWYTPLHYVLTKAQREPEFRNIYSCLILNTLLKAGANPNSRNNLGNTPLHEVSSVNHINLLWQFGAGSNKQNKHSNTPLMFISSTDHKSTDLLDFLMFTGVDLNTQNIDGNTALHMAIKNKKYPFCYALLKYNATFTIPNKEGQTAACYAKDVPKMRKEIEPYMQRFLWELLHNHDFKSAKNFMKLYPWMSLTIKGESLAEIIKDTCTPEALIFFNDMLIKNLYKNPHQ